MEEVTLVRQLGRAVSDGDTPLARKLLTHHPDLRKEVNYFLQTAARHDDVAMMKLLVEFGADIHAPDGYGNPPSPEGVIATTASAGAINAVRWLLEQGAKVNFQIEGYPGQPRCMPLMGAASEGHLDVAKLLVEEGGANVNAFWAGFTPLGHALMYGHKGVADYLRSKGALEPWQLKGEKPPGSVDSILEHAKQYLGKPQPLSLQEIVPGDPPITIHAVRMLDRLALLTSGMSARPLTVPDGAEDYQYAELFIYLPRIWPLTAKALRDPNHFWPIEWLRRIAHYPHQNHTWLGAPAVVIANGEPPQPLAPNTRLTCLLAATEESDFGTLTLSDGRRVVFYGLYPLYTEERDLEKDKGTENLLRLFQKSKIPDIVDVGRPNVALLEKRRQRR